MSQSSFGGCHTYNNFRGGTSGKEPPANAGEARDWSLISGSGRATGR